MPVSCKPDFKVVKHVYFAGDGTTPSKSTLKRGRSPGSAEECSVGLAPSCGRGLRAGAVADADGYRMEREWDPEPCGCGWHVLCNPERIGMLTDKAR